MKHKDYIVLIVAILALHLVFVNSDIIIKLLKSITSTSKLSFLQISGAVIFALSYSLITVLIISVYPKVWMFGLSALFDGFAVFLNYSTVPWFSLAAAIYLGIYTTLIIVATGFIERNFFKQEQESNLLEEQKKIIEQTISRLSQEKKRLQLSYNRTQDQNKREQTKNKLLQLENKINQLQNLKQLYYENIG